MTDQSDAIWRRAEIESPCQNVCIIAPESRLCIGCARSGEEIAAWSRMTPDERRVIMADLPARDPNPKRRKGRAPRLKNR